MPKHAPVQTRTSEQRTRLSNKKKCILPHKCEVCDILAVHFELMEKKIREAYYPAFTSAGMQHGPDCKNGGNIAFHDQLPFYPGCVRISARTSNNNKASIRYAFKCIKIAILDIKDGLVWQN